MEKWKDVVGYEGLYQVSNLGRVKSLERLDRLGRKISGKILCPYKNKFGYIVVTLSVGGIHKNCRVNRLVAEAFIPNPENKPEVNHKDTNKENNHVSNLEWNTRSENQLHAYKTGLQKPKKGRANVCSKTILQYSLEGNLIKEWGSIREAGRELGITFTNISECCKSKNHHKSAGGFIWKYKKEDCQ